MIVCEQVEKRYGRKTILTQISFEITEPKIVVLLGEMVWENRRC